MQRLSLLIDDVTPATRERNAMKLSLHSLLNHSTILPARVSGKKSMKFRQLSCLKFLFLATFLYIIFSRRAIAQIFTISPAAGQVVINEVLYAQTGAGSPGNDEFIELYNASSSPVDLSGWRLADGNLIANSTDGIGSITGNTGNPAYLFPPGTTLPPGRYAVIWIGDNTPNHQAINAVFQTWLGQSAKLNNTGDDVWLYDSQQRIVDYIAYGSGTAINTPPPASLNLWNSSFQSSLGGATAGQSISLTPNGQDSNTSACWERTTSGNANGRCPGALPTLDTDAVASRITTVGQNNNSLPTSPSHLRLVKRITRINGRDITGFIDNPGDANDDTTVNWPTPFTNYLRGAIDGGLVQPGDEVEYTIYFLSDGGKAASNVKICDLIPANTTFIPNTFNNLTPTDGGTAGAAQGIALALSTTNLPTTPTAYLTNVADADRGQFFTPGTVPAGLCASGATNGAVVVNVVTNPTTLPNATAPGTPTNSYGFIRFRARVE